MITPKEFIEEWKNCSLQDKRKYHMFIGFETGERISVFFDLLKHFIPNNDGSIEGKIYYVDENNNVTEDELYEK